MLYFSEAANQLKLEDCIKNPWITMDRNSFSEPTRIKPVTHEQVFFDKFWLGKFYLLVCKEEFVIFFLDKCTCSKASMIALEQVHLAREKLSHCRICLSVWVDKENLSKKIRKLQAHSCLVVVIFRTSSCSERKKLWNFAHLLLLVLALNCFQNLETDFVFALPKGEPTTSDSYVSSSAHIA